MSNVDKFALEYSNLFDVYRTELDCLIDAMGKIAANECTLSEDDDPALCLPPSIDLDSILRIAAKNVGRKLIKRAARVFSKPGQQPLNIRIHEFCDHWSECPRDFNPISLWNELQHRFGGTQPETKVGTAHNGTAPNQSTHYEVF